MLFLHAKITLGRLDEDYCSGSLEKPKSNNKFGKLRLRNSHASVNIKNW